MARILSRVKCTPASTKRLAENIANAAPVVVLSVIIMWSYLAYVFSLSGVLMMTKPVQASLYLIFYHPLFIMFVWSYYKAVSTDPGSPADSIPMHNDSTTFASPRPSTDHESEALQPLTTEAMFVQEGHQSAATVSHAESPFSTSTANLLRLSHARNGLGVGSGAVFGRQQTMMVKENGQRRYCQKCRSFKFDRTHHCSTCKKCVLKMDHHCPWINNCVGHHNQKAFHLFIIYGSIYCVYVMATVVPPLVEIINVPMGVLHMDFNWAFLVLISGIFGLFLVPFTIFHTHQLLSNRTTIETYERAHYRLGDRPRRGHPDNEITTSKHLNIWDLGKRKNFMQVMGPEPKLWFIPINNSEGDGLTFPLNGYAYDALSTNVEEDDDHEQQMVINVLAEESGDESDY